MGADPVSLGLAAVTAAASIAGGFSQARGLNEQAQSRRYQAGLFRMRARQQSARGQQDIADTISSIRAMQAGQGADIDDPTAVAIRREARRQGRASTNQNVLNELLGANAQENEAKNLRRAAPYAVLSGFAQALPSIQSGIGS